MIKKDLDHDWKSDDIANIIDYKLKVTGIDVIDIEKERNDSGEILYCKVRINPIKLKDIERESFPFGNWSWQLHS